MMEFMDNTLIYFYRKFIQLFCKHKPYEDNGKKICYNCGKVVSHG